MKDTLSIVELIMKNPSRTAEDIYNEATEISGTISLEQTAATLSAIEMLKTADKGWLTEVAHTVKEIRNER